MEGGVAGAAECADKEFFIGESRFALLFFFLLLLPPLLPPPLPPPEFELLLLLLRLLLFVVLLALLFDELVLPPPPLPGTPLKFGMPPGKFAPNPGGKEGICGRLERRAK